MRGHWFLAIVCAAATAACGSGTPTVPTLDRLALPTGSLVVQFLSFSTTDPACTSSLSYIPGVSTRVTLTHEGAEWIARSSSPADGTLEFRFHDAGSSGGTITVAGTVTGMANEGVTASSAMASRATFSNRTFTGAASSGAPGDLFLNGTLTGPITYTLLSTGETAATCSSANLSLKKPTT